MRKTKEVLRLRFELGLGQRQIARSCGMGLSYGSRLFGTGGCGRDRLAVARRPGAKRNWKPSCLGTNPSWPERCGSGRNRTGKRFMSNSSSIVI